MLVGAPVKGDEQTCRWGKLLLLLEVPLRDLHSYTQLSSASLCGCPAFPLHLQLSKQQSSGLGVVPKELAVLCELTLGLTEHSPAVHSWLFPACPFL